MKEIDDKLYAELVNLGIINKRTKSLMMFVIII